MARSSIGALILLPLAIGSAAPSHAARATVDRFDASTLEVRAGGVVDFDVRFTVATDRHAGGGSNPTEPAPEEGHQEWLVNWYHDYGEQLVVVSFAAMGQSFEVRPSVAAGATYAGQWTFSVTFPSPGRYDVDLAGQWETRGWSTYSAETASRGCWYDEFDDEGQAVGGLRCDWWQWSYEDNVESWDDWGGFAGPSRLSVVVTAVPEPATAALWAAGLGWLAWRAGQPSPRARRQP